MVLKQIIMNYPLRAAALAWIIAQVIKVLIDLIGYKKVDYTRIYGAGGMPSSHTSFVTALTAAVALNEGLSSSLFAVCVVFSFVVMYDASGVRRAAGEQAALLNRLVENFGREKLEVTGERLKELVGHSPLEVFAGAALGIAVAIVTHNIF